MYVRWVRWTIRRVVSRALERGRASSRGRARATASTSFVVARTCNDGAWTSERARARVDGKPSFVSRAFVVGATWSTTTTTTFGRAMRGPVDAWDR